MYSNQSYFGYTETDMYFINLCLRATDFNKGWSQHCANGAVYVPAPGTTELCEIHKGGGEVFGCTDNLPGGCWPRLGLSPAAPHGKRL